MNQFFIALSVALVASSQVYGYSAGNSYQQQSAVAEHGAGDYNLHGTGLNGDSSNSVSADASANAADNAAGYASPSSYGSNQNIPYESANTRGNTISSSFTYPNNKGEILVHNPSAIIVKRPATKFVLHHPTLVVKPSPVVFHKPAAVVVRKVFVKNHPRPVKVAPVYVNVVKPPAEKYYFNEKQQEYAAPQQYSPTNINADGYGAIAGVAPSSGAYASNANDSVYVPSALSNGVVDSSAASAGYQLLQNNHGLAALAKLSGSGSGNYGYQGAPSPSY